MVNNEGQLYTIEGVAAAVLLVVTAYVILNSTILFTPGDTHINDMQLEQLGNDVLRMMDTGESYVIAAPPPPPDPVPPIDQYYAKQSYLEKELSKNLDDPTVQEELTTSFIQTFRNYAGDENKEIKLSAALFYKDGASVKSQEFWDFSTAPKPTNREHYVTVTKWVSLKNPEWGPDHNSKTVLLEVLLWRD